MPTSVGRNVPAGRGAPTAVWTGTELIVWGGVTFDYFENIEESLNTGGRYNPVTDAWMPTSLDANVPSVRSGHTAVWTGSEMIVWGGSDYARGAIALLNTGSRYEPSTDSWVPTSVGAGVPMARDWHTAVWTGTEVIVWGGRNPVYDGGSPLNTGGRYNPITDSWVPTGSAGSPPSPRFLATAVPDRKRDGHLGGISVLYWGGIYCVPPNRPPVANAGPEQVLECTGNHEATVTLDGSRSADPDSTPSTHDNIISFDWFEGSDALARGEVVQVSLPSGPTTSS